MFLLDETVTEAPKHSGFAHRAHNKLMDIVREADIIQDTEGHPGHDCKEILCTCGEEIAGFGVPYHCDANHAPDCPWGIAERAEYDQLADGKLYVNVYLHDRAFGGSEEGGWWYDTYEILQVIPVMGLKDANTVKAILSDGEYTNTDRRDVGSVLSEGVYRIEIEDHMGESKPERRPHYE